MLEFETEVAILKNDVSRITNLFAKMDTAIEKMGDVSNSIARMLAVHEEKLNKQESADKELYTLIEQRRSEIQIDIKDLHSRITTVHRELSSEMSDIEHKIMNALSDGLSEIKQCITEENKSNIEKKQELEDRIVELEKWRWILVGGSIVLGGVLSQLANFFKP